MGVVEAATRGGLRERKKLETRRRLIAAATELFARNGFSGTTLDDLAGAANIAPRTFFSYFATKEDVLLGDHQEMLSAALDALEEQPPGTPAFIALVAALERLADLFDADDDARIRYSLVLAEPSIHGRSLALQALWEQRLAAGLERRLSGRNRLLRAHALAAAGLGCLRCASRQWTQPGSSMSVRRLLGIALEALSEDATFTR
jgi:AcrR family transcriptional regulator